MISAVLHASLMPFVFVNSQLAPESHLCYRIVRASLCHYCRRRGGGGGDQVVLYPGPWSSDKCPTPPLPPLINTTHNLSAAPARVCQSNPPANSPTPERGVFLLGPIWCNSYTHCTFGAIVAHIANALCWYCSANLINWLSYALWSTLMDTRCRNLAG